MAAPNVASGMVLTAGTLRDFGREGTWTPTLTATTTNPTLGTGATVTGDWLYKAGWVTVRWEFVFGSGATAGSGTYLIGGLPFTPAADWSTHDIGNCRLFDSSASAVRNWIAAFDSSLFIRLQDDSGGQVSNANPWTWAQSDHIRGSATYQAA